MEKYIRPEDEIKTPEGELSKQDRQRTGFIPIDQIPDPDREQKFYKQIDASLQENELLKTLMDQDPTNKDDQNNTKQDDPMEFYRQRYPDLFPSEENIAIKDDEDLKTLHDKKASKNESKKTRDIVQKQGKFHRKGTPKKDRRHGKESDKREVLKIVNKRQRKRVKEELRKLAA